MDTAIGEPQLQGQLKVYETNIFPSAFLCFVCTQTDSKLKTYNFPKRHHSPGELVDSPSKFHCIRL